MKAIKKTVMLAAIMAISITFGACSKTNQGFDNTVIGKVGSTEYTTSQMIKDMAMEGQLIEQYSESYRKNPEAINVLKEQVETYIKSKTYLQAAIDAGLDKDTDGINKYIEEQITLIKENNSITTQEEYTTFLEKYKIDETQLNDMLKETYLITKYQESIIEPIGYTEEEKKEYFNSNPDIFKTKSGADVYHILVATEEEANEVKARLEAGEDFETVAKEKSTDPSAAQNGGNLGFNSYEDSGFVPEFEAGYKDLKAGEISNPIKSTYGYHVIKIENIKEATPLAYEDEETKTLLKQNLGEVKITDKDIEEYYNKNKDDYSTVPGATVYQILVNNQEEANAAKARLDAGEDFATVAKEVSKDTATASSGGNIGYVKYGENEYSTEINEALSKLKEGEISAPIATEQGYVILKATGVNTELKYKSIDEVRDSIKDAAAEEIGKKAADDDYKKLEEKYKPKSYPNKIVISGEK